MMIVCNIPNKRNFNTTLEKLDKFIPPSIVETNPMSVEFITFCRGNTVQLRVKPFPNSRAGYIICAQCDLLQHHARWLKYNKEPKQIVFTKFDNGNFACAITEAEEVPSPFFE